MEIHKWIDERPLGALQMWTVLICLLISMLDGFDILAMAYTAAPLSSEWELTDQRLGWVFSAALIGMMIGSLFLTPLADLFGRRRVLIGALIISGLSMVAVQYVDSFLALISTRAITGIGIGTMLASLTSLVSEYTPNRHRNLAIGLMLSGYGIGAVIGGFLAAWAIPAFGWRSIFVGGGLATLGLAAVSLLFLPESLAFLALRRPRNALHKINHLLNKLNIPSLSELPPVTAQPVPAHALSLLKDGRTSNTLLLWTAFLLAFCTLYFLLSWLPKMLIANGLPQAQSIYAGTSLNLGMTLGIIALGFITARLSLPRTICVFMLLAAGMMVAIHIVPFAATPLLMLAGTLGFFMGGSVGLYSIAARLYPTDIRTTGVGWAIGIGRLGAIIGPILTGELLAANFSMNALFTFFALPLVLAGLLTLKMKI